MIKLLSWLITTKKIISSKAMDEIFQEIPCIEVDDDFFTTVKEKWNKPLSDITFKDIENHRSTIGKLFGINKTAIILANIVKGCVEIHWLIPRMIIHIVKSNFFKKESTLEDFGIVSLDCTGPDTLYSPKDAEGR